MGVAGVRWTVIGADDHRTVCADGSSSSKGVSGAKGLSLSSRDGGGSGAVVRIGDCGGCECVLGSGTVVEVFTFGVLLAPARDDRVTRRPDVATMMVMAMTITKFNHFTLDSTNARTAPLITCYYC